MWALGSKSGLTTILIYSFEQNYNLITNKFYRQLLKLINYLYNIFLSIILKIEGKENKEREWERGFFWFLSYKYDTCLKVCLKMSTYFVKLGSRLLKLKKYIF